MKHYVHIRILMVLSLAIATIGVPAHTTGLRCAEANSFAGGETGLAPVFEFSPSYRGPGGHDYRNNRLARVLQRRKAAVDGGFPPFPPPAREELAVRVPVILIEYPDSPMTVTPAEIEDLMFGSGSSPNMTEYYEEVSYGQFTIDGDVYGPYRVSTDYADYTEDDRVDFITEAVDLADGDIDYSNYDSDGDGVVDAVIVVASEYIQVMGYESAHMSIISNHSTDDGIAVNEYTSQGEDCNLGTYCHEIGHVLGLPDLYSGGSGQTISIGDWGLMGQGNSLDPPAHFCAWSKLELGWLDPIEITESVEDQPIGNVVDSGHVYKLSIPGVAKDEYLLIENRQPVGSDAGLPGDGLLIWHVGYHDPADPDTFVYDNRVVLVPAGDGSPDWAASDDTDPFPGSTDTREYTDEFFGLEITDISDSGLLMYADFHIPESIGGWRLQESPLERDLCAVSFTDEEVGWAAGTNGMIIHTDDGGETWMEQKSGTREKLTYLCFLNSSTGWAAGGGGVILKTSDGGNSWEEQYSTTSEDINSISFVDSSTGWALTDGGTLLKTVDGGETWIGAYLDTDEDTPVALEFADGTNGFVAGLNQTVFSSTDGGESWSRWDGVIDELNENNLEISKLRVRADNDLWLLGKASYGYLIWVWEDSVTYFTLEDHNTLNGFDLEENLGVAVGDQMVIMNLRESLGYGLDLFSLDDSSGAHQMDRMEWIEIQDWAGNLDYAPRAVDVASGEVAYAVGDNGLILRYDWESGGGEWTSFTHRPPDYDPDVDMEDPVTKRDPDWVVNDPVLDQTDPAEITGARANFYLENRGPVIDLPLPVPLTAEAGALTLEPQYSGTSSAPYHQP